MPSRAYRGGRTASRASFSVFAAIFLLFSTSLAAGVAHQLHQSSMAAVRAAAIPRYLVVLVLDGGEPSYLHITSLPHLDALRAAGIEYDHAFAGILESETPAGHATLSTGSTPARDGMLGFNWISDNNTAVRLFNPDIVRAGAMEHVMQQAGVPTIASLFKARYPHAKVIAVSGHKYYAADPLGGPNADYIMYYAPGAQNRYVPTAIPGHVPPASILNAPGLSTPTTTLPLGVEDTLATKLSMESFKQVHQQVTLINLPEFDYPLGHVDGGQHDKAVTLMKDFDRDLGYIEDTYRKAGVLDKTAFVITADHGMAPLKYQIPDAVMDDAVTKAGTTSLETTYSTAGYIWLQNAAMAQSVADNVLAAKNPYVQAVYYKVHAQTGDSYVLASGQHVTPQTDTANQYLLQSFLGGNAPDVVTFCTEDSAFAAQGASGWKGNHGGGAWRSQHIPLIIAGPGVAAGVVSHAPVRLEDVAPTALALFKIKSTGMQGSVLADGLQSPSPAQTAAQQQLSNLLNPVVSGLIGQSKADLTAQVRK